MRVSRVVLLALLAAPGLGGCSTNPQAEPSGSSGPGVKPVPVPAELVGKWRFEQKLGDSRRTGVFHISADGYVQVDVHITTPQHEGRDRVKSAITEVEGNKLTVIDISHTSGDNAEELPTNRQPRIVQFRVAGNELHWGRGDEAPWILTRTKD
jgi:hypothetical protein